MPSRRNIVHMNSPFTRLLCVAWLASGLLSATETQQFTLEKEYPVNTIAQQNGNTPVSNVILMIGDGMGIHHLFAAGVANKGKLFIENCPVIGISKTRCTDKLVTDSAAAGTAMATGSKTLYHRVAVSPNGDKMDSLVDKAADMGKSTGVIATCELNDATPASFCSNNEERSHAYEIIGDYPTSRADFIFGGGSKYFTNRPDGRNIFQEMQAKGYKTAHSWEEAAPVSADKMLIVTAPGNLPPPSVRGNILGKATAKALNVLSRNPNGFFLMVEGSNIDKAAHRNNLEEMVEEVLDFDQTVGLVLEWASRHPGTLVVITADHNTGSFSLVGGDQQRGEIIAQYASHSHDDVAVPVYAYGAGCNAFSGIYENADIFHKIMDAFQKGADKQELSGTKDTHR